MLNNELYHTQWKLFMKKIKIKIEHFACKKSQNEKGGRRQIQTTFFYIFLKI